MSASALFEAGRLGEAVEAQLLEVKAHPADPARRVFLFELAAFAGDLDRAARQLEAVHYGDSDLDLAVLLYRKLLDAERARRRLWSEGLEPEFLGDPPEHLRARLRAVASLRDGRPDEAAALLGQAAEATGPVRGTLNGRPFGSLRDADDLFAGVLEVMAHGRYFWVGLDQLTRLSIKPPRYPRDLLFLPASMELGEAAGEVFLPALYPRSHEHTDDLVRLGRLTDWSAADGGPTLGAGPHTYLLDDDEIGLLAWREFEAGAAGGPAPSDAGPA